jgi:hypothetical protein
MARDYRGLEVIDRLAALDIQPRVWREAPNVLLPPTLEPLGSCLRGIELVHDPLGQLNAEVIVAVGPQIEVTLAIAEHEATRAPREQERGVVVEILRGILVVEVVRVGGNRRYVNGRWLNREVEPPVLAVLVDLLDYLHPAR